MEAAFREALFGARWAEFTTLSDAVVIVDPASRDLLSSLAWELSRAFQVVNRTRPVGHSYEDDYDLRVIRELICNAFADDELRRFCEDRPEFRPVLLHFGDRFSLLRLADVVIGYCRRRALLSNLLSAIERENPRQFARYRDRIYGRASSLLDASGLPLTRKSEAPEWDPVLASLEEFQRRGTAIRAHEVLRRRLSRLVAEITDNMADRLTTHTHLAITEERLRDLAQRLYA